MVPAVVFSQLHTSEPMSRISTTKMLGFQETQELQLQNHNPRHVTSDFHFVRYVSQVVELISGSL